MRGSLSSASAKSFPRRRRPEKGSVVTPAGTARDRPLSDQPERLVGRVGLTLLPNGELRPGRLRPFVRRGLMSPSPVAPPGDPTRVPFGPGHQPLGPVLRYGL